MVERKRDNHELIFRYLLGEMAEEDQTRLERGYFAEDGLFEELLVVEDELIDSYARGEFSEHERKRIERHFLRSRTRRERFMFARALIEYSAGRRSRGDWRRGT
jgi:hypothetical protein